MILQIFVHTEFSLLPRDTGHFADSNSIPWDLTTTFHPIQTANNTADVPSFTLHTARSAIPLVSDLRGVGSPMIP